MDSFLNNLDIPTVSGKVARNLDQPLVLDHLVYLSDAGQQKSWPRWAPGGVL